MAAQLRVQSQLRGIWALLTCAAWGTTYYDQCQSSTTSTVVKAPLVRASLVKRRYIKYLALPFFYWVWASPVGQQAWVGRWVDQLEDRMLHTNSSLSVACHALVERCCCTVTKFFQSARSCARRHAVCRPMLAGFRSFSTVRVHVCLDRPQGISS